MLWIFILYYIIAASNNGRFSAWTVDRTCSARQLQRPRYNVETRETETETRTSHHKTKPSTERRLRARGHAATATDHPSVCGSTTTRVRRITRVVRTICTCIIYVVWRHEDTINAGIYDIIYKCHIIKSLSLSLLILQHNRRIYALCFVIIFY